MRIEIENTEDQLELIKAIASKDPQVAYEAKAAVADIVAPVISRVINTAPTVSNFYRTVGFGEDENPEKNRFEENTQKFSWSLIDEKYNDYRSLILTPKYVKILMNETGLSDQEVKEYICNVICKEDNDKVRERNNQKAKERRERK